MKSFYLGSAVAVAAIASVSAVHAQSKGVDRLYILECGQGHTGDMSRWTPGRNVNVPMDIVDNCYLIRHAQGYFLWDTGVVDSTSPNPPPGDPAGITWRRPKTLAAQLNELGVRPDMSNTLQCPILIRTMPEMSSCFRSRCFLSRRPNTNGPTRTADRASSRS